MKLVYYYPAYWDEDKTRQEKENVLDAFRNSVEVVMVPTGIADDNSSGYARIEVLAHD